MPGLVVLRVCSSDRTAVFAGVREQIVHLLFTAIVVQLLGSHPTPQVTDLYSRLPFGIASRVANTHLALPLIPAGSTVKTIFPSGSRRACNS